METELRRALLGQEEGNGCLMMKSEQLKTGKPGPQEDTSALPELLQINVFFSLVNTIRRRRARTGIAHPAKPCNCAQL